MEEHNLTKEPIFRDSKQERRLSSDELIAELKKAFDFNLSEEEWKKLGGLFHVKTIYEDEIVFRSGDFNDTMYFILRGELVLFSGSYESGGEFEVARLQKGAILGESCMTRAPFTLNCRASQFTEMIGITRDDIQKLVDSEPALGVSFYQQVLMKVVLKTHNNNLQSLSMAGGTVRDSFIDGNDNSEL
jgi:CRP-like cAMP-binding protein